MYARLRKAMEEKEEGFTLIELLVVIIIIGILAAIAIPVFLNQRKKGWDAQAKSDARNLATLEETYFTDNNKYQVATTLATATTALQDYKPSATVQDVVIKNYAADGTTLGTTQDVGGYCISVKSNSTNWFTYDSTKGGLQATAGSVSGC
ncbi:MAG: prepilin-type N-terminal cleavage/methylation domain-containing protein [Actinomycetota bacterium]